MATTTRERLQHRATQLRRQKAALEIQQAEVDRTQRGIERQYLDLADKHKLEFISPVVDAPIPVIDLVQDGARRRFRTCEIAAAIVGTTVAAGLFVKTISAPSPSLTLLIAAPLMLMLGAVSIGLVELWARSNPRNPPSIEALRRIGCGLGVTTTLSFFAVLWLRFATNVQTLDAMAMPIAVFEISLIALAGTFACMATTLGWSRQLTAAYAETTARLIEIAEQQANVVVELEEIKFQLDLLNANVDTEEETASASQKG